MISTVTLNPAYDKTVEVQDLIPHETNKILTIRFDPGGKGINVSRVVKELGYDTKAMGIIGGDTGGFIKQHLERKGIRTQFVEIDQPTRTNLSVIDIDDPPATVFTEPGPLVDAEMLAGVEEAIEQTYEESDMFVLAGSLPRGCPLDTYYRLIKRIKEKGCLAVLDTRDEPLAEGIKARPYLIKPNNVEAGEILGRKIITRDDAINACKEFYEAGIKVAIISLGKDGAVMACDEGIYLALPPDIKAESTVGAGDSMVAGVTLGIHLGKPLKEALRLGTAAGAATAMTPGTELCRKADVEALLPQVVVEELE